MNYIRGKFNEQVIFVLDGYNLILVPINNAWTTLNADENGYIWGTTLLNASIAIYIGKKQSLIASFLHSKVTISHYILFHAEKEQFSFNTIKFENGALRSVNPCNALHEDFEKEEELNNGADRFFVFRLDYDSKKFIIPRDNENNENVEWLFTSRINREMSADKGDSIRNDISTLLIKFENEQNLASFISYYGFVTAILAFLTFRRDIAFEKITLEQTTQDNKNNGMLAECFIKAHESVESRKVFDSIKINTLTENTFISLVHAAINNNLPIAIIPENARAAMYLPSDDDIKNICSLLEAELSRSADTKLQKSAEIKKLIEDVLSVVSKYKERLSEKTYSSITGNIKYWNDALVARISKAWDMHKDKISQMLNLYGAGASVDMHDKIGSLFKARNNLTHQAVSINDAGIQVTAFIMIGFIYCMVLKRLGVKDEMISEIMKHGFIG